MNFQNLKQKRPDVLKEYLVQCEKYYKCAIPVNIIELGSVGIMPHAATDQGKEVWDAVENGSFSKYDEWVKNYVSSSLRFIDDGFVKVIVEDHISSVCAKAIHENEPIRPEWSHGFREGVNFIMKTFNNYG